MKNIILIIVFSLLLFSCRSVKDTSTITSSKSDSSIITEKIVYKDTIIKLPGDTIRFQIPCDKDTVFIKRAGKAQSLVMVKDNQITITNTCDSLNLVITKIRQEYSNYVKLTNDSAATSVKTTEIIVYKTPGVMKISAYIGWICILIIGIKLYFKFK